MARFSANILSVNTAALIGSVLLMGATPATPQLTTQTNLVINQLEDGILPGTNNEVQALVGASDVLTESDDAETRQRQQFLLTQTIFAAAIGLSAIALAYGVRSYSQRNKQQQLEFLRNITREFENDPDIAQALKILDFEEYRSYQDNRHHGIANQATTFNVTDDLLSRALADDEYRQFQRTLLENLSPDAENYAAAMDSYYAETTIRDWFNKMLNSIEHFSHLVEARVFTVKEVKPWLLYWVRLIADEKYRRNNNSRIYNQLYNYIHDHGFTGVRNLFERFGYRILRTPYQADDFTSLKNVLIKLEDTDNNNTTKLAYSDELALSLAKASMLVYQDTRYVLDIMRLWGVKDLSNNFKPFEDKKHDTQAFIFRTEDCIVLAFRGSQEIRDWYTNFSTQLRKFTIRREGQTTVSSYKGRVHTGFFLGWASIEKKVLAQIKRWQDDLSPDETLPPLFVTGHSLGGALATMAAASLQDNNMNVAGLYTFGQPRVGDLTFTRQLNTALSGKAFRFINNNDVVPHVPPPFSVRNPTRLYAHLGTVKYFNSKGLLVAKYKGISRALDGLLGLGKSLFESGFDLITDHSMSYYISYLNKAVEEAEQDQEATKLETDVRRLGGGPDNVTPPKKKTV
ncbi:MAG: lipase family protein [Cyanobacteria bacterium P01_F01_bin.116]